jgi:transcriptional regulator with XRE-family HTH domain
MSENPENFGSNIKKELERKDWTQLDLANLAGLTPAGISQIVNGQRTPNLITACKIAEALSVSLDELLK